MPFSKSSMITWMGMPQTEHSLSVLGIILSRVTSYPILVKDAREWHSRRIAYRSWSLIGESFSGFSVVIPLLLGAAVGLVYLDGISVGGRKKWSAFGNDTTPDFRKFNPSFSPDGLAVDPSGHSFPADL